MTAFWRVMFARLSENRISCASECDVELLEGLFYLIGWAFGWPLRLFKPWLDRQPDRDPSQISTLHKIGRLALGAFF